MPNIVGTSAPIQELHQWIDRAAGCVATVAITGESGTGKELVAQTIHERSPRASAPFIPVNCGAIPEQLIEAELFGHERGAFTGADKARDGLFAAAQGGTIFLDEFCEMHPSTQVRLLRVLQERKVKRLGSTFELPVNVRVIVATNKDPAEEMKAGRLREDLYYRINVLPLRLPALRERRGDIPALVKHLLSTSVQRALDFHLTPTITQSALSLLIERDWPGNVRELENQLERLALLAGEGLPITPEHVAEVSRPTAQRRLPTSDERLAVMDALVEMAGGNQAEAARITGLPRMTFYQRRRRARLKLSTPDNPQRSITR